MTEPCAPQEKPSIATVLVSQPGIMRDSLHVMLKSLPGVQVVGVAGGGLSAQGFLMTQTVEFVILDANLPEDEATALLVRLKESYPRMRCLALTMSAKQDHRMLAAGADAVLPWNCSFKALAAVVG